MKESELRAIIREHVKKTLKEAGPSLGAGGAELSRGAEKVSGRVARLSKRQRLKAVIPVLQKFGITSGDLPMIKAMISKANADAAAAKAEAEAEAESEAEVEENYTAGVDDGDAGNSIKEGSLDTRSAKLDKTQAFKMLQKAVDTKPASMQADFIVDLINKFNLDDSAKRRLKMQIRNMA
jgi:hypothetical protein